MPRAHLDFDRPELPIERGHFLDIDTCLLLPLVEAESKMISYILDRHGEIKRDLLDRSAKLAANDKLSLRWLKF
jgi:hypothetical protein